MNGQLLKVSPHTSFNLNACCICHISLRLKCTCPMNFFIYRMEWCKIFCEEDNKTHTVSSRALEPEDSEVLRCPARKGLRCCGRLRENGTLLHCLKFTVRIETCSQKFIIRSLLWADRVLYLLE